MRMRRHVERQRLEEEHRAAVEEASGRAASAPPLDGRRPVTPRSLRGLPMTGGASGAIPGTTPHQKHKFDWWRGR